MEPLHDDDAVLAAAFAFIDELHDTDESSTSGSSDGMARATRWKQQRRSEVDGLKTATQELERFLTQRQETDEAAASPWASVAERQRLQRGDVVVENALLKEAVRERAAEARRLLKLCEKRFKDQSLLGYAQWTPMPCRVPVLNDAVLTAALQQSLDMIFLEAQHAPRTPQPTSLTTTVQSFGSKRSTCGDGIDIDVVDSGYFPFQLHLVDRVQWDCVLRDDAHVGDARRFCIVQPDGIYRNYTYYVQSKIGGVAVQGVTGIRRIYEPDGSVLVLWSSQSFPVGTDNSPDTKILDRFQLTETGWIRFSRAAHSTLNQTVVFADVKHRVKIRARRPQDAKRESLRDAKESMVQVMSQHGGKQRQLLENRLLDAKVLVKVNAAIQLAKTWIPEDENTAPCVSVSRILGVRLIDPVAKNYAVERELQYKVVTKPEVLHDVLINQTERQARDGCFVNQLADWSLTFSQTCANNENECDHMNHDSIVCASCRDTKIISCSLYARMSKNSRTPNRTRILFVFSEDKPPIGHALCVGSCSLHQCLVGEPAVAALLVQLGRWPAQSLVPDQTLSH